MSSADKFARPRVSKIAVDVDRFRRQVETFPNARTAFKSYLAGLRLQQGEHVLLPAYIGWSPLEGSGVFDPLAELGLSFDFYALDERLHVDLTSYENALKASQVRVVVLIHYFGYVDPAYEEMVTLARERGVIVVEDSAHALFTDLVGGACGRRGDVTFFSLHKMLPVAGGSLAAAPGHLLPSGTLATVSLWEYDLMAIAHRRRQNSSYLLRRLAQYGHLLECIRPTLAPGEVPQTFPIRLLDGDRDHIYRVMNAEGYGVVSLYHTMIPELSPMAFPAAHALARRILNLPVHQDVTTDELGPLVDRLLQLVQLPSNDTAARGEV